MKKETYPDRVKVRRLVCNTSCYESPYIVAVVQEANPPCSPLIRESLCQVSGACQCGSRSSISDENSSDDKRRCILSSTLYDD